MSRTVVTQEALIEWLNAKMSGHKECSNCHFSTVVRLAEPDEDGCNWSPSWLQCSGKPVAECRPVANEVAEEARKLFNLKDE